MSEAKVNCPRCGAVNEVGGGRVIFCVSCGELIDVAKVLAGQTPRTEQPSSPPPLPPKPILQSPDVNAAEMPEQWQDVNTQVPSEKPEQKTVMVNDLVGDLDLESSPPSAPPPEPPPEPPPAPQTSEPTNTPHQDQDATLLLVTPTPYQKALAVSAGATEQFQKPPRLPPRDDSLPTNPATEAPPSNQVNLPAELPTDAVPSPLETAPGPVEPQVQDEEPSETEPAADALFEDLDARTQTPLLSNAPPPPVAPSVVNSEPPPPTKPRRPVTEAPSTGEDPFAHLVTPGGSLEKSSEDAPSAFDDLAALSAEVKASEKRARTAQHDSVAPSSPPQTHPDVASTQPRVDPPPPPSPEPERPKTNTVASSHGLKIDFVSAPEAPKPAPVVTALPDIRTASLEASRPITGAQNKLRPASNAGQAPNVPEESPEDIALASIARPAIIVPLSDPSLESTVKQMAVAMTGTVKKARVNYKKSMIVSGLLLTQAKLLREKLRAKNIQCQIVDPATIQISHPIFALLPSRTGSSSFLRKALLAAAVIAGLLFGARQGMNLWQDYRLENDLRVSVTEQQNLQRQRIQAAPPKKKVKPKPVRSDLVPYNLVRYGGRDASWWTKRIRSLRLSERSAPADERAAIRVRLLDTERKARALGVKLK